MEILTQLSVRSSLHSSDRHNAQPGSPVRGQGVPVAAREGEEDPAVQQGPRRPHQGRLRLHHLEGHSDTGQETFYSWKNWSRIPDLWGFLNIIFFQKTSVVISNHQELIHPLMMISKEDHKEGRISEKEFKRRLAFCGKKLREAKLCLR